jgi:predicted transcriptional regulator
LIIKRLFEQNALGTLSDERLAMLTREYEEEQQALRKKTDLLDAVLNQEKNSLINAGHFIRAITQYKGITELDADLLHEIIEKIVVHEAEGVGKARKQKVVIYWRYVGLLPDK